MQVDLYTLPHKAIRAAVAEAALAVGAAEPHELPTATAGVLVALEVLSSHAAHEEEFIDPVLERLLPDHARSIGEQHRHLTTTIDGVRRQIDAAVAAASEQPGATLALYRAVQRLSAENLLHLDHEETVVMPALWITARPSDLAEVMDAFRAAHPDASDLYRRWPRALAADERRLVGVGDRPPSRMS